MSESFRTTISGLAGELGADLLDWSPETTPQPPDRAALVLLMAGGVETEALDLLGGLPPLPGPVYVVGAASDHRIAAGALQRGAKDYFALPEDLGLLRRSLERERRTVESRREAGRYAEGERATSGFGTIVGQSDALRRALEKARRAAQHRDVTVLITGETGTGKELLARAVHYQSPRAAGPFVEINCAAIPAQLLESELFGHEKGAFTGAVSVKPGLLELAHGGTVFLDEIGNLPIDLQPKLLRALENREVRRVGGQSARKVDVRIIAATHVDLRAAVGRGEFREDLFYRLNVVSLGLPPLREREGDVELLAETFLVRLAAQYALPVPPLDPEARGTLRSHSWPGNVRELRNTIERALVLSPPGTLVLDELTAAREPSAGSGALSFPATLRQLTEEAVQRMLELSGGNKSEAARRLGISRPRLQRILDGGAVDE